MRGSSTWRPARSCAQTTHQGWRDDSSWARGPELGALWFRHRLHGFTGDERFLDTAAALRRFLHRAHAGTRRAAERLGGATRRGDPYESSAAAIAASGLLAACRS